MDKRSAQPEGQAYAIRVFEAKAAGKSVLVMDKRPNIAGNVYTEKMEGIHFHKYGAHIFHTSYKEVWEYVQQFVKFNNYIIFIYLTDFKL